MSQSQSILIDKIPLGTGHPAFIVAEMSGNHGGDINIAKKIIKSAHEAGASAVKLQTYTADTITLDCDKEDFSLPYPNEWGNHKNFHSLYHEAHTPWDWHAELFSYAKELGIPIFSAPFDETAVDLLERLDCPAYKIASPEIFHIPLIEKVARTGKPVIVSTGLAESDDIELAVETLRKNGCNEIVVLKCTTAYPAPMAEANLATIPDIAKRFSCLSGLSDHTAGIVAPLTAVALGADFIEKHFTIKEAGETVDSFFSLNEDEFKVLVSSIRDCEAAIGKVHYQLTEKAKLNLKGRRSIYASSDIKAGELISTDNIQVVRPGHGLHPKYYHELIGKKASTDIERGDRMSAELIEDFVHEANTDSL